MYSIDELCSTLKETKQFDQLELRILQAMLKLKQKRQLKLTAAAIAKEAGISVTNAYKYLYSLQLKGLVESNKEKNRIFWLSRSSNPFPRLLSFAAREFAKQKALFLKAEKNWAKLVPIDNSVWAGQKVYEHYDSEFSMRAAFLFDAAHSYILITSPKFYSDVVLLEALYRAANRKVDIRFIAEEIDSKIIDKIRRSGIQIRLGRAWPYIILVDGIHGMTSESEEKGLWFLNHPDQKIKQHFEQLWARAQEL